MGREGLGLTCTAARITHWMGLPANFPGTVCSKYLSLKGAGRFSPYKEDSFACQPLGQNKAAGLSVLRRFKPSGGFWSL